jgi:hypothetical protein
MGMRISRILWQKLDSHKDFPHGLWPEQRKTELAIAEEPSGSLVFSSYLPIFLSRFLKLFSAKGDRRKR